MKAGSYSRQLQQLDRLQVVFADLIHDHVEDHLNVGRVRGRGVVVVHGSVATWREHGCDEMGSGVNVTIGPCGGRGERVLIVVTVRPDHIRTRHMRRIQAILAKHRSETNLYTNTPTFIFGKIESEMSSRVTDLLLEKVGFVQEQNLNQKTTETTAESLNFPIEYSLKYTTSMKYTL